MKFVKNNYDPKTTKEQVSDAIQILYGYKDKIEELDCSHDEIQDFVKYFKKADFKFDELELQFQNMFHEIMRILIDKTAIDSFDNLKDMKTQQLEINKLNQLIEWLEILNKTSFDTQHYRRLLMDEKQYIEIFVKIFEKIISFGKSQDELLYRIFEHILDICLTLIEKITRTVYNYQEEWKKYDLLKNKLITITDLDYMPSITDNCIFIIRNIHGFAEEKLIEKSDVNLEPEPGDSEESIRNKWKSALNFVIKQDSKIREMINNHDILVAFLAIGSYERYYEFDLLAEDEKTAFIKVLLKFLDHIYAFTDEKLKTFETSNDDTDGKIDLIKHLGYMLLIIEKIVVNYSQSSFQFCIKYSDSSNGLEFIFNLLTNNNFLNLMEPQQDQIFQYLTSSIVKICCKALDNLKLVANKYIDKWSPLNAKSNFSLCKVCLNSYKSNITILFDIVPFVVNFTDNSEELEDKILNSFYEALPSKRDMNELKLKYVELALKTLEEFKDAPKDMLKKRSAIISLHSISNLPYNLMCNFNKRFFEFTIAAIPHLKLCIKTFFKTQKFSHLSNLNVSEENNEGLNIILHTCYYGFIIIRLLNITNNSTHFCMYLHEESFNHIKQYFEIITDKFFINVFSQHQSNTIISFAIKRFYFYTFALVLNISKVVYKYKNMWKNMDAFNVLLRLGKKIGAINEELEVVTYMTIANIASNDDLNHFASSINIVGKIANILRDFSLIYDKNSKQSYSPFQINEDDNVELVMLNGWNLIEIIHSLYQFAVNDNLKGLLYDTLNVKTYLREIIYRGSEVEKEYALKLLRQLCFDKKVAEHVLNDANLIKYIKKLIENKNETTRKNLVKHCEGIIWLLDSDNKKMKFVDDNRHLKHIMISYNSESRPLCISLKQKLESLGHKIWIDVENIHGSTIDAMAKAVENAWCVLVCMTEKYKESTNCRSEAEYIVQLNKPFVPLIMQKKYKPDGWLGFILGTKIYIDFTKYDFDECIARLIKEISVFKNTESDKFKSSNNEKEINRNSLIINDEIKCSDNNVDKIKLNKSETINEALNPKKEELETSISNIKEVERKEDREDLIKTDIDFLRLRLIRKVDFSNSNIDHNSETTDIKNSNETKDFDQLNFNTCMSEEEVEKWLVKKNICLAIRDSICPCDGRVLEHLCSMSNDVPDFFYTSLRADTRATLKEIAQFTIELRTLFKKR